MANKRLIDANALNWRASQERMEELFPNWKELPQEVKDMLCKHGKEFERLLKEAPTIDAVEVVHGRWVMKETMIRSPFAKNAYCSVCLEETSYAHNYCPNCGAKMGSDGSAAGGRRREVNET